MTEIEKALSKFVKSRMTSSSFVGKVLAVDQTNYTCDIEPADGGAEFYDVRLKPVIDSSDSGIINIPAIDSYVIVSVMDGDENRAYVSFFSEITSMLIKTNSENSIELKNNGEVIINGGELED